MTTDVPVAGAPTVVGPGFGALGGNGTLGGGGGLGAVGGLPSITALPAVSPSPLLDVGFQVAGGDPLALDATSATIAELEDQLRGHATTIQTAPQCAPTWTGEAAQAYANLSDLVAAHFHHAANTAADARAALARWSTELHRCQREGMIAVTEAQHWLAEIKTQALALTTAETDTATSQVAVGTAQANLALAHALGPITAVATPRLQADITAAQNALTTAQDAAQAARTKLDQARHELAVWQARGRQAWQDAEHAAETATGTLAPPLHHPTPPRQTPHPPHPVSPVRRSRRPQLPTAERQHHPRQHRRATRPTPQPRRQHRRHLPRRRRRPPGSSQSAGGGPPRRRRRAGNTRGGERKASKHRRRPVPRDDQSGQGRKRHYG